MDHAVLRVRPRPKPPHAAPAPAWQRMHEHAHSLGLNTHPNDVLFRTYAYPAPYPENPDPLLKKELVVFVF